MKKATDLNYPRNMKIADAASVVGVTPITVRRWVESGKVRRSNSVYGPLKVQTTSLLNYVGAI